MAKVGRLANEAMLKELTEELSEHKNFFVTTVERIEAGEHDTLRKRLRGVKAKTLMVKRTLGLRALNNLNLESAAGFCEGAVNFVLPTDDVVPTAKILVEFAKANQDKLALRGGCVDGHMLDGRRIEELSQLPPTPQLIAQVVAALEAPVGQVAAVLESLLYELTWILEEAAKKHEGGTQS